MSESIDLALGVLDHQLLDSEERRCGKVDDLELEQVEGKAPRVTALVAGRSAWKGRGRLGRPQTSTTTGRIIGRRLVRWWKKRLSVSRILVLT